MCWGGSKSDGLLYRAAPLHILSGGEKREVTWEKANWKVLFLLLQGRMCFGTEP